MAFEIRKIKPLQEEEFEILRIRNPNDLAAYYRFSFALTDSRYSP